MDKTLKLALLLALAPLPCAAIAPQAILAHKAGGSCGSYVHYRVITVPAQSSLSGDLSNYPMLVSGTYSYLATVANGGSVQNASGYDVAFYTDNTCTTKLNWEVETYTASSGLVNYWVQVPTISKTSSVTFVMVYDNASISTDQSNKTGTWDSNFTGVYHTPDGTTLSAADSTSNANNGTNFGATATTGEIDGGSAYNGSSHIDLGNNLLGGTGVTIEAWVKATSFANAYNSVVSKTEANSYATTLLVKSNGLLACYIGAGSGQTKYDGTGSHTLSTGTWYHLAFNYNGTVGMVGYVNGAVDATVAQNSGVYGPGTGSNADVWAGAHPSFSRAWNGSIDEIRVSNIVRSADWILTDYNSQSSPSTFYSVGTEH